VFILWIAGIWLIGVACLVLVTLFLMRQGKDDDHLYDALDDTPLPDEPAFPSEYQKTSGNSE